MDSRTPMLPSLLVPDLVAPEWSVLTFSRPTQRSSKRKEVPSTRSPKRVLRYWSWETPPTQTRSLPATMRPPSPRRTSPLSLDSMSTTPRLAESPSVKLSTTTSTSTAHTSPRCRREVLRSSLLAVSLQLRPQPTRLATMCMTGGTEPQESAPPCELSPTETIMVPPKASFTVSLAQSTTLVNGRSLTISRSTRCPAPEWTPLERNWLMSAKWPSESELIYFQP